MEHYFIDPKKGIYYLEKTYHGVDHIYIVEFDLDDEKKISDQFKYFLTHVKRDGVSEFLSKVRSEYKSLFDLIRGR